MFKKQTRTDNLNIDNTCLEQVKQFKHLGSIINNDNSIEKEIKKESHLVTKHILQIRNF